MRGMLARASPPRWSGSTGTSRQPTRLDALRTAGVLDRRAGRLVAQEHHREAGARLGTQRFGEWQQQAGAVPGLAIPRDRPAMAHLAQALEQGVDDRPRGAPADVRDEPDPAGVPLERRVVEESSGSDRGPASRLWYGQACLRWC